jgi:hypothetical protein
MVMSRAGITMEILLRVAGPGGSETQALLGWLLESPKLSGEVRLAAADAIEGAQGPGGDVLAVALGSGGTLTALALCLRTWIEAYYAQRRTSVHVEVTGEDGKKVVIDASNAEGAEAVLRQLVG